MKKVFILFISILLLVGCGKKKEIKVIDNSGTNEETVEIFKLVDTLSFEINSELKLLDLIDDTNGYEISDNYNIDTSRLGEQEIIIKYMDGKKEKEFKFTIDIIDTKVPVISFNKELTTSVGKSIDLLSGVSVSDNSNEEIMAKVEGEYSFDKDGIYHLKYVALDSSGNKAEEEFTLVVKKLSINVDVHPGNTNPAPSTPSTPTPSTPATPTVDLNDYIHIVNPGYKVNTNVGFVQSTTDFVADSKQEIMNIFYTGINEGADSIKFTCNYSACKTDLDSLLRDKTLFDIQDFVHPYNIFNTIQYSYNGNDMTISGVRKYSVTDIASINPKVNEFINSVSAYSNTDKVKAAHDYIINMTSYDLESNELFLHNAVGPFVHGRGVCEGYAHAMSILLYKMGIANTRISSPTHMWNLVYVDGRWYHLDATWDDPIYKNSSGVREEMLRYDYFLIDKSQITKGDSSLGEHVYNINIYKEA